MNRLGRNKLSGEQYSNFTQSYTLISEPRTTDGLLLEIISTNIFSWEWNSSTNYIKHLLPCVFFFIFCGALPHYHVTLNLVYTLSYLVNFNWETCFEILNPGHRNLYYSIECQFQKSILFHTFFNHILHCEYSFLEEYILNVNSLL